MKAKLLAITMIAAFAVLAAGCSNGTTSPPPGGENLGGNPGGGDARLDFKLKVNSDKLG
jgi:hypothetical protein